MSSRSGRTAHLAALPPALDEAGAVEDREVLDDGLPRDRQLGREHGGGRLTAREEQVEQAPARRLGDRSPELVLLAGARGHRPVGASAVFARTAAGCRALRPSPACCRARTPPARRGRGSRSRRRAGACRRLRDESELDEGRVALPGSAPGERAAQRKEKYRGGSAFSTWMLKEPCSSQLSTEAAPGRSSPSTDSANQTPTCSGSVRTAQTRSGDASMTISRSIRSGIMGSPFDVQLRVAHPSRCATGVARPRPASAAAGRAR